MNSEILKHLTELSLEDSQKVYEVLQTKQITIRFKYRHLNKIEAAQVIPSGYARNPRLFLNKEMEIFDEPATFSFAVGTEMYFFMGSLVQSRMGLAVDLPTNLMKLNRRKSTRYIIPEHWQQAGSITFAGKKDVVIKMRIIEMSNSGFKVKTDSEIPKFDIGERVALWFKLHRRGDVHVDGVIRHAKSLKEGQVAGIEFILNAPKISQKIDNLCQDLILVQN